MVLVSCCMPRQQWRWRTLRSRCCCRRPQEWWRSVGSEERPVEVVVLSSCCCCGTHVCCLWRRRVVALAGIHAPAIVPVCCLWCRRVVALTGIHAPAIVPVCCLWRRRVVALTGIHAPADSQRGLLPQPSGILLPPCLGVCLPSAHQHPCGIRTATPPPVRPHLEAGRTATSYQTGGRVSTEW